MMGIKEGCSMMHFVIWFAMIIPATGLAYELGNTTTQLNRLLQNPYGIVFDYPNAADDRSLCASTLQTITNSIYNTYINNVVNQSFWTNDNIDSLADNGTMVRSICAGMVVNPIMHTYFGCRGLTARRLTLERCYTGICNTYRSEILAKGCITHCGMNRKTEEKMVYPIMRGEMKNMVKLGQHRPIRRRNVVMEFDVFSNCTATQSCNYKQYQTNTMYQGWKNNPVQTLGTTTITAFYREVDKVKSKTCRALLNSMTHWIYPILCYPS